MRSSNQVGFHKEEFRELIDKASSPTERWTISIGDFIILSGLSKNTIYRAISLKKLNVIKIGKRTLISIKEAKKFLSIED